MYTFSILSHSLSSSFTSCTALCPSNLLFYFLGCIWPINTISVTGWCVFRKLRELKQTLILVHRAQLNPNRGNVHNWILWSFHFTQSKYETDFLKEYTISVHITIKLTASDLVVESGQITRSFCSIVPGISPMECKEFRICKRKCFVLKTLGEC